MQQSKTERVLDRVKKVLDEHVKECDAKIAATSQILGCRNISTHVAEMGLVLRELELCHTLQDVIFLEEAKEEEGCQ